MALGTVGAPAAPRAGILCIASQRSRTGAKVAIMDRAGAGVSKAIP